MKLSKLLIGSIITVVVCCLSSLPSFAQRNSLTVSGTVSDSEGPLSGVSVIISGTTKGVVTDLDGNYQINDVPSGAVLEYSFMGYQTQSLVANSSRINVLLEEDTQLLEETVVIGYGTVKKSDLTGSVSSISEEDLGKSSTGDPLMALQGRAAGVQIMSASGDPSSVASIKIRGTGSMNGSDPLYVVDGFAMDDIDFLSPNDIASIEILKDASATAIYGSRGANGVVMITTKKGEKGRLKTTVRAEYGIVATPTKPDMLNATEYAEMTNLVYANSGLDPKYSNTNLGEGTDWYKEVMRVGQFQNYNLTLSGGSDKVNTVFSATFYDRTGTVKSTDFQRVNISSNTQFQITNWLKFSANLSGAFSTGHPLSANGSNNNSIFLSSLIAPPDVSVWDESTGYYSSIDVIRIANPAGVISRNNAKNKGTHFIGNFALDATIVKGLVFTSRFGYRYFGRHNSDYSPAYYENSNISDLIDTVSRTTREMTDWSWENMLTYSKEWEKHSLSVMGAISAREYSYETYTATKQSLPSADSAYWYFDAASENPQASGSAAELAMMSYLARVNYSFLNRYLLTASFRADGSSRFTKDNRWGYFPSVAAAWKLSEEPFFEGIKDVWNEAKIRIGWGQIGNERISSYYPYLTGIEQQNYYTIGSNGGTRTNGSMPSGIGNEDVQWETSEQFNVGIDVAFLSNRLTLTADYYKRTTDNILLDQTIPSVSGFSSMTRNVGGMSNKGVELAINWKDSKKDFSYSVGANFAFNKNEVTDLGTSDYLSTTFDYDNALINLQGQFTGLIRSEVGHPYGQFYGYKFLGIFQNEEQINSYTSADGTVIQPDAQPGDSIFADLNGDGTISTDDMTFIGDPNPDVIYGFNFDASWKGFDLSLLFQGTIGNDIFNASKFYFNKFDGTQNVLKDVYMKAWNGEGTSNSLPIALANSTDASRNSTNWSQSTMYVEDGSYLRLKTLQIGYTFNRKKVENPEVRISFTAQNLFTITGYSGFDPEVSDLGVDRGQYPQPRTFTLGVNLNF